MCWIDIDNSGRDTWKRSTLAKIRKSKSCSMVAIHFASCKSVWFQCRIWEWDKEQDMRKTWSVNSKCYANLLHCSTLNTSSLHLLELKFQWIIILNHSINWTSIAGSIRNFQMQAWKPWKGTHSTYTVFSLFSSILSSSKRQLNTPTFLWIP